MLIGTGFADVIAVMLFDCWTGELVAIGQPAVPLDFCLMDPASDYLMLPGGDGADLRQWVYATT